jgi:hypothetical protein
LERLTKLRAWRLVIVLLRAEAAIKLGFQSRIEQLHDESIDGQTMAGVK